MPMARTHARMPKNIRTQWFDVLCVLPDLDKFQGSSALPRRAPSRVRVGEIIGRSLQERQQVSHLDHAGADVGRGVDLREVGLA